MTDTITIKQLAIKAGMEARDLRRLLRSKFPRKTKGKAYEWETNDPQVDLILQAVTDHKSRARKVSYNAGEQETVTTTANKKSSTTKLTKGQPKTQKSKTEKVEEEQPDQEMEVKNDSK